MDSRVGSGERETGPTTVASLRSESIRPLSSCLPTSETSRPLTLSPPLSLLPTAVTGPLEVGSTTPCDSPPVSTTDATRVDGIRGRHVGVT